MLQSRKAYREAGGLTKGQLITFGSILLLGFVTTLTCLMAGLLQWHTHEMLVTAASACAATAALAAVLVYWQIAERRIAGHAFHNVEARFGGLLEAAMDAIITVDEQQHIVQYNAAAENVFRWPREAVLGEPLSRLIPARFHVGHRDHIERFGSTGATSRRMGVAQRIIMGLRSNGEEFPIEASISQIREEGGKFYTVILRDVTERVRAEDALRSSQEVLRKFSAVANSIREQEKSRIARELHDELAQALTALKMDVAWVTQRLPVGQQMLEDKLAKMLTMLDNTVIATRRIAADLRPLLLDDLGLVPATEWLVQNFMDRTGLACDLTIATPELVLPEPYATAVFRILQESLTNVAKHAHASLVEVSLDQADGLFTLSVRDNGCGFDVSNPRKPDSYGLVGLRERAFLVGGEVEVESGHGRGTLIEVRIPITKTEVQS